MSDTTEPTHDVTDRPCLILDLPELSDEAGWQLSEFLQTLAEHIDAHYATQILRAHRALEVSTPANPLSWVVARRGSIHPLDVERGVLPAESA